MVNIINEFCALLESHGAPVNKAEIVADDRIHTIKCELERKNKKTISYQLKIDGDIGVGWFHSFKHGSSAGQTIKYFSRSPKKLTAEQKKDWAEKMAEQKQLSAIRQAARKARQVKAARKLSAIIMPLADRHAYLDKKKIQPHGVMIREKTGELLIPVMQPDGMVLSFQKISADGSGKWYMRGCVTDGGFYIIGKPTDIIFIAEGFATAASIYEAVGHAVYVAFTAHNLKAVAQHVRSKHGAATIILAADNDHARVNHKGELENIGIIKATEAAGSIGGFVIVPDFPLGMTDGKKTDWNDLADVAGAQAMAEQLREKLQRVTAARTGSDNPLDVVSDVATTRPPIIVSGDWRDKLICDQNGKMVKGSLTNAMLFLEHHDTFAGVFKQNDFQKEIYLAACPPWIKTEDFTVHRLTDVDITSATGELEKYGLSCEITKITKAIAVVAEKHSFHPAREYFNSLQWDGQNRLKTWLAYYMGAEGDDFDYLAFIGTKWLVAAVKRVFEPGCKFDHVLVMEGKQGRGKSTALQYMATFGDVEESYFTDNIKITDIQNKDTILLLQGSIIVELAELAGFNKKDDEEIKGWITLKYDRCRKPYDRTITVFPRQFVLAATTNSYDYLKDPTGNRRYWPFSSSSLDLEAIKRDRMQLWAEAVSLYKSGYNLWPTDEEMALAEKAQHKRRTVDTWEDDVLKAANRVYSVKPNGFTTRDVFVEMEIPLRERDYKATRRVAGILQQNDYENAVRRVEGKNVRVWVKSDEII